MSNNSTESVGGGGGGFRVSYPFLFLPSLLFLLVFSVKPLLLCILEVERRRDGLGGWAVECARKANAANSY